MLYGISRADSITYFAVALGVLAVTAFASAFPAHRAARVDPMLALRQD
jgi:ABC-type lipoprotein release transport system permease subunit